MSCQTSRSQIKIGHICPEQLLNEQMDFKIIWHINNSVNKTKYGAEESN